MRKTVFKENGTKMKRQKILDPTAPNWELPNGFRVLRPRLGWMGDPNGDKELKMIYAFVQNSQRMRDLNGQGMELVLGKVGWSYVAHPVRITIIDPQGDLAALSWSTLTSRGINMSYAVADAHEGKGLATLAASFALTACFDSLSERISEKNLSQVTVHAQFDSRNIGSRMVAQKMGLQPSPELCFKVNVFGDERSYEGLELGLPQAIELAKARIDSSMQGESESPTERQSVSC